MQEQSAKMLQAKKALTSMAWTFIGQAQLKVLSDGLRGEEWEGIADLILNAWKRIKEMPQTYETSEWGAEKTMCELHYFRGNYDAWITEKDMGANQQWTPVTQQLQAFGLIDMGEPEVGYISIVDLLQNGFELDLHWTPKSLAEVSRQARNRGYN